MTWYYARHGQRFGPVEQAELQRLAGIGQFAYSDLVWRPGLPDWRPASEIPELAYLFRPASPPVPVYSPSPPVTPSPPPSYGATPLPAPGYGAPPHPFGAMAATEYASFGVRFGALLIDCFILLLVWFAMALGIFVVLDAGGTTLTGDEPIWTFIPLVLLWVYYAGLESSARMATFGKSLLKLRVTNLQGQRISFGRATGRHFGKILSALPFYFGFLTMISDPRKQTWHDQMADCLVLRQR